MALVEIEVDTPRAGTGRSLWPLTGFGRRGRHVSMEYVWLRPERRERPLVVFLHEGLGAVATWRSFPARMCAAGDFRGLVYSRYGFGGSTPRPAGEALPADFMEREAIETLPAFLAAVGAGPAEERPWLLGHSDGASIALLYAACFPQAVAGVIAVAPHVAVDAAALAGVEAARAAYPDSTLRQRLGAFHPNADAVFARWSEVWRSPGFRKWDLRPRLPQIACPVLALQGDADEYATLAHLEAIVTAVPHARARVLPHCGHAPHREQPETLIAASVSFIVGAGSAPVPAPATAPGAP